MKHLVGILCIVFIALAAGCIQGNPNNGTSINGRAVVTITDAAANMGAVSSVQMTVDSVQVHSDTQGWVTLSSQPKTYDLLQLKAEGSNAILADAMLKPGTYNQIRMDVSSVVVTDTQGQHQARMPSSEIKVNTNFVVEANSTSAATFDVIADESLHVTGNGEYVMAPVMQVEARQDAQVQSSGNSKVIITGGSITTNMKVGMDASGNVGIGLGIPLNANITIGTGGTITIGMGNTGGVGLGGVATVG